MGVAGYAVGVLALIVVVASSAVTGVVWRRRLLAASTGSVAAVAALVLSVSSLVLVGEILGTIGWFSRWPLVALTAAVAIGSRLAAGGRAIRSVAVPKDAEREPRWTVAAAAVAIALLCAQALLSIRDNGRSGTYFVDALAYHLPWASHFAATHETTSIVHFQPGGATSYYALNDELLRAITMALTGRDAVNLLVGPLAVAAMLLAAWAVGASRNRGALAVCVVAPLIASYGSFLASGTNDWAAIWPITAAVALLLHLTRTDADARDRPRPDPGAITVIGLALGLAAGTKFSLLAPVVLLAVGIVLVVRDHRLRTAGLLIGGALLGGGYWFVRNAVVTGTPLPTVGLPGLPRVPMSAIDKFGFSVAHYLTDRHVISSFFVPGLHSAFGPLWWLLLALAAIGVVLACLRAGAVERVVAVVVVLGVIAYLVTPTTALGPKGEPLLFAANTRYAWPVLALGLLLLALDCRWRWWPAAVSVAAVAVLVAQLTQSTSWAGGRRAVVVGVAVTLAGAALVAVLWQVAASAALRAAGVAVVVAVLVAGYPLQHYYLQHRYRSDADPRKAFLAYMQRYQDTSIGVVGIPQTYPLEGPTWSNDVAYVGALAGDDAFEDYHSCSAFIAAVRNGGYRVIAVGRSVARRITGAEQWVGADPAARQVFRNGEAAVFELGTGFGTGDCTAGR